MRYVLGALVCFALLGCACYSALSGGVDDMRREHVHGW